MGLPGCADSPTVRQFEHIAFAIHCLWCGQRVKRVEVGRRPFPRDSRFSLCFVMIWIFFFTNLLLLLDCIIPGGDGARASLVQMLGCDVVRCGGLYSLGRRVIGGRWETSVCRLSRLAPVRSLHAGELFLSFEEHPQDPGESVCA